MSIYTGVICISSLMVHTVVILVEAVLLHVPLTLRVNLEMSYSFLMFLVESIDCRFALEGVVCTMPEAHAAYHVNLAEWVALQ